VGLVVHYYLRRRLASGEGIVTLGVHVCNYVRVCVRRAAAARRISRSGEGNVLYPVLSSCCCVGADNEIPVFYPHVPLMA